MSKKIEEKKPTTDGTNNDGNKIILKENIQTGRVKKNFNYILLGRNKKKVKTQFIEIWLIYARLTGQYL
jgi:hypothetical protein